MLFCSPLTSSLSACSPAKETRLKHVLFSFLTTLVWALVICVFSAILLCALAFLVLGWFKLSSFFYFQRFGYKQRGGVSGFTNRNSSIMDASKAQTKTGATAGEGPSETDDDPMRGGKDMLESEPSNIVGRSMSYLDVSNTNEDDRG
jgi:hypothetical protein